MTETWSIRKWFDLSPVRQQPTRDVEKVNKRKISRKQDRYLFCRRCRQWITSEGEKIVKMGASIHVFTNPQNLTYQIGCYHHADGCGRVSELTEEWTWFPGYAWSIVVCTSCSQHLGWYYQGQQFDSFFGLILSQLVEESQ